MPNSKYTAGIYAIDFEFRPVDGHAGNPPDPVCLVVKRLDTGETNRFWYTELKALPSAPYPTGPDALCIAYYSSAEWGCFIQLGWTIPINILDLYTEFRCHTNGTTLEAGAGLNGALTFFGLPSGCGIFKEKMREVILKGGPWSDPVRKEILDYCEDDVTSLSALYTAMKPYLNMPLALLRGRYMAAAAWIESIGIPVNVKLLARLTTNWERIKTQLLQTVDEAYGVYSDGVFRTEKFAEWLNQHAISWPIVDNKRLDLTDETFEAMALTHPILNPLRQLRKTLSTTRKIQLEVGDDGRSRTLLSAFQSKTGRNQPSTTRFLFALPSWMRALIAAKPGTGLAYIDWAQQEFGIGAALSNDKNMIAAYRSGDPYLKFAIQSGAVPSDATGKSHPLEREQFKQCVLATQYGLGAKALAARVNVPITRASQLLELHRVTYSEFWAWSEQVVNEATLGACLWTCFGWKINTRGELNDRSLRNFPMQAHGAEMLRIACILMAGAKIRVCAPVHDAVLIEAPLKNLEATVVEAKALMAQASRIVLNGFELNTDVEIIRCSDRLNLKKGQAMWEAIQKRLIEDEPEVPL